MLLRCCFRLLTLLGQMLRHTACPMLLRTAHTLLIHTAQRVQPHKACQMLLQEACLLLPRTAVQMLLPTLEEGACSSVRSLASLALS